MDPQLIRIAYMYYDVTAFSLHVMLLFRVNVKQYHVEIAEVGKI